MIRSLCVTVLLASVFSTYGASNAAAPAGPGSVFRDCKDCPEMVVIPSGSFLMGSNRDTEQPVHEVKFAAPFAVSKFEITRGEYSKFVKATGQPTGESCNIFKLNDDNSTNTPGKSWQDVGFPQDDRHPVVCITPQEARAYAEWLSKQTGKPYRLISEAEWEYSARAGAKGPYTFGSRIEELCSYGNVVDITAEEAGVHGNWGFMDCKDGYGLSTAPVGSFKPNAFGLYDVHGNVWEWTADCWENDYTKAPTDGSAYISKRCLNTVMRGGSWDQHNDQGYRIGYRQGSNGRAPRFADRGFRIARGL